MWLEFFRFELRNQVRQPLLWVVALFFGLTAFAISSSDASGAGGAIGNVHLNAPSVIMTMFALHSLLASFVGTIFIAGAVLKDAEVGIADMIFATPMRKIDYLLGRYLAGVTVCLLIFVVVTFGMMAGPYMPWVDPVRVGAFSWRPFLFGFGTMVIPNVLFIGAFLFFLAATTRSIMSVYLGLLGLIALWVLAGVLARDVQNEWTTVLLDPFGARALHRMMRYFSTNEINTILPGLSGFYLINRLFWMLLGGLIVLATMIMFKPQRSGTGRRWFGRARLPATQVDPDRSVARVEIAPAPGNYYGLTQCWRWFCFDLKAMLKSVPFLVILLLGVVFMAGMASQSGKWFGTSLYPVTRAMLNLLPGMGPLMIIIVVFYGGELIFRERQVKLADVMDALPVPNWVPLVAKALVLSALACVFLLALVVVCIVVQSVKGGVEVEWQLYLKGCLIEAVPFMMMGLCGLALQVFANQKYLAYVLVIGLWLSQLLLEGVHWEHNLYGVAGLPRIAYSDMNGYGHFWRGWVWFAGYWSCFVLALLILAQAYWVRGQSQEWCVRTRLALARLRGPSGVALALCLTAWLGSGGWIFYNTNILNHYQASDTAADQRADYEKRYRQYLNLPHPRLVSVRAEVDIYPERREVQIRGHYGLQNKTAHALDTLRIQLSEDANVTTAWQNLPPHQVLLQDARHGFSILKLKQPLAPGAHVDLDFTVSVKRPGFTNGGEPDSINENGTFFTNREFFPQFGYNTNAELLDPNQRRQRQLGEPVRSPKLEDEQAREHHIIGGEADWVSFDTTVSTSLDQIALAPGFLHKSWEANGRRYYHYQVDQPTLPYFAWLSARWAVKKGDWRGVPIEIYYHPAHGYNVDRMIDSIRKSLDYYSTWFTPYPQRQVRIVEFPSYQSFAQSFTNTIPYSEALGFIADLRDPNDVDYVYFVTAHELAHQWWGYQLVGANMQGSTMLMESLAQYFALMVMEKEYGRDKMRRFLRYELDSYLNGRGSERIAEQPLLRVENQRYIHYEKGSLVFYRLRDEIGEEALNRALKRFLQDKRFQGAPYPTSRELLGYIRAEAPPDKQELITDLFEKIVFYDNRVVEASAKQRPDGKWDVHMKLHLAKMESDGVGKETPRTYDEPVEIAVFARPPEGKERDERVLFLEKRLLHSNEPDVTVTVKEKPFEVGVDPYNKLIDRVARDNRKIIQY